jgi:hypothetical protein
MDVKGHDSENIIKKHVAVKPVVSSSMSLQRKGKTLQLQTVQVTFKD